MFDNRHCTQKDLDNLIDKTNKVLLCLKNDAKVDKRINAYIEYVSRFDSEIAFMMKKEIQSLESNQEKAEAIKRNVDKLKQNILVDIYEHQ